jgi:hypothetical protein
MHSRGILWLVVGVAGMLVAMPAAAADPAVPKRSGYDPDERICETVIVTGSRLGAKRYCATRAEWDERRRLDREATEAAQRSPCVIQRSSNNGPSC